MRLSSCNFVLVTAIQSHWLLLQAFNSVPLIWPAIRPGVFWSSAMNS